MVTTTVALYVLYVLAWLPVVRYSVLRFKTRLAASIVIDQAFIAAAVYAGGDAMAPAFWLSVSVSLGCGLLGGAFYAKFSSLLGGLLLAIVFARSPFWTGIPLVSIGIAVATVAIPWHATLLAERIAKIGKEMHRRALVFEEAARTDSLTGALNRAGFLTALGRLVDKTSSGSVSGAVMLLDLDGFKAVNDEGGHAAGDEVLKEVARRLRQSLRSGDNIARIGGDEFGILLHDLSASEDVERLALKVLHAIETIDISSSTDLKVTASLGVFALPARVPLGLDELLVAADQLMYEAKKAGKNQYRISHESRQFLSLYAGADSA
jgi:diguanylate cyclase (GGDEF)-like protein